MTPPGRLGLEDRPQRDPDVAWVVLDDESVLFHEVHGQAHLFNPTATMIWTSLTGDVDLRSLVAEFVDATGAPWDVIEQDVLMAVQRFAELGLLAGIAADQDRLDAAEKDASQS